MMPGRFGPTLAMLALFSMWPVPASAQIEPTRDRLLSPDAMDNPLDAIIMLCAAGRKCPTTMTPEEMQLSGGTSQAEAIEQLERAAEGTSTKPDDERLIFTSEEVAGDVGEETEGSMSFTEEEVSGDRATAPPPPPLSQNEATAVPPDNATGSEPGEDDSYSFSEEEIAQSEAQARPPSPDDQVDESMTFTREEVAKDGPSAGETDVEIRHIVCDQASFTDVPRSIRYKPGVEGALTVPAIRFDEKQDSFLCPLGGGSMTMIPAQTARRPTLSAAEIKAKVDFMRSTSRPRFRYLVSSPAFLVRTALFLIETPLGTAFAFTPADVQLTLGATREEIAATVMDAISDYLWVEEEEIAVAELWLLHRNVNFSEELDPDATRPPLKPFRFGKEGEVAEEALRQLEEKVAQ